MEVNIASCFRIPTLIVPTNMYYCACFRLVTYAAIPHNTVAFLQYYVS